MFIVVTKVATQQYFNDRKSIKYLSQTSMSNTK